MFLLILFSAAFASADDFNPSILTFNAPEVIEYSFDDNALAIPLDVQGTPAATWLVINTHGKAEDIVNVRNGFLGWHYVNKIDTTVYISDRHQLQPGSHTILWDGRNQDGNPVEPADYGYYFWGYDDQNPRQKVTDYLMIGFHWDTDHNFIYEKGEDGLPLAKPLIMGSVICYNANDDVPYKRHGTHHKWEIGSDPYDLSGLQTTWCAMYKDKANIEVLQHGGPAFNPQDYNIFYHSARNVAEQTETMFKWEWVEDGEAIRDESWLGWDRVTWSNPAKPTKWNQQPTPYHDDNYMYITGYGHHFHDYEWNMMKCVSYDGEVIFDKMMHSWYFPDDGNELDYVNGQPSFMDTAGDNKWFMMSYNTCLLLMIDTTNLLLDPDDESDMVVFENRNGDGFLDADTGPEWYCMNYDIRRTSIAIDANGFNVIGVSSMGLTSMGVATQVGTGIAHMRFADDTVISTEENKLRKNGVKLCQSGSNYDGLYLSDALIPGERNTWNGGGGGKDSTNFIAFDSCRGLIKFKPAE